MAINIEPKIISLNELADDQLVVLFGPPGSGKTHTGMELEKTQGRFLYETEVDFPLSKKLALARGERPTLEMDIEHFANIYGKLNEMLKYPKPIVLTSPFTKNRFREEFLANFPQSRFVMIEASETVREARISGRGAHTVNVAGAMTVGRAFELPITIPYSLFRNE